MIIDILPILRQKRIILASQSPRRSEILKMMDLPFDCHPSKFSEDLPKDAFATPNAYAIATAKEKALDVGRELSLNPPNLIIASDTIVVLDGAVLEKPESEGDAFRMLRALSGRQHTVCTAVALKAGDTWRCFCEESRVWFSELSDDMISAYIKTGEPMDKAGAYGIQGKGGAFVSKIDGCFFSVMGLPMHSLAKEVRHLNDGGFL